MADNGVVKVNARPSEIDDTKTLRRVFNEKATELNVPVRWSYDDGNRSIDPQEISMNAADWIKYGICGSVQGNSMPLLTADIKKVYTAMKVDAQALVEKALAKKKDFYTETDLNNLPEPYQKIALTLLEIEPHYRHLYELQMHPEADRFAREIRAEGEERAMKMFDRNYDPTCSFFGDEHYLGESFYKCALTSTYPERTSAAGMWPEGMHERIFDELKLNAAKDGDPTDDPFLSPFTSVYWKNKENSELAWRSFYDDPQFHDDMEAAAKILDRAADAGEEENRAAGKTVVDLGLIRQLRLQAKAHRSSEAYPYKESDVAWMKAGGPLKLCVGPYETRWDEKFEKKAFFQFILAMEDSEKTAEVQSLASSRGKFERVIAGIIGDDVYQARDLEKSETTTPFVHVIKAVGDAESALPVTLAYNLPNLYRDEIGFTVQTLSNHYEAKKSILEEIGKIVIDPEQQGYISYDSFIDNGHYHEFTHASGPQPDMMANGKDETVGDALGDTQGDLEETKADTGILIFSDMRYGRGSEGFKKDAVTALTSLFRSARFGLDNHGKGGLIRLAYFLDNGAIERKNGGFYINFDKAYEKSAELIRMIGRIQANGDRAAAQKLIDKYMSRGMAILEDVRGKINAAGIPIDVDIHYKIKGAEVAERLRRIK